MAVLNEAKRIIASCENMPVPVTDNDIDDSVFTHHNQTTGQGAAVITSYKERIHVTDATKTKYSNGYERYNINGVELVPLTFAIKVCMTAVCIAARIRRKT